MPMLTNREEMKGLYLSYDADSQILDIRIPVRRVVVIPQNSCPLLLCNLFVWGRSLSLAAPVVNISFCESGYQKVKHFVTGGCA